MPMTQQEKSIIMANLWRLARKIDEGQRLNEEQWCGGKNGCASTIKRVGFRIIVVEALTFDDDGNTLDHLPQSEVEAFEDDASQECYYWEG